MRFECTGAQSRSKHDHADILINAHITIHNVNDAPLPKKQEMPPSGTTDIQLATRIEEIRHRIQIESRVIVGAKNIVRTLSSTGGKNVNEQMKKTIAEVRFKGLLM